MHGEGVLIDNKNKKWQGYFKNGLYQSKLQTELKILK